MEEKGWKRPRIQTGELSGLRGPPRSPAGGAASISVSFNFYCLNYHLSFQV
ncbi:unnamed protein product [Nyctereutes procyonoides]|uniref:(raccoon dog) hypothetical protein n=1 Tax=Nyctereutes procyonoides TaxID=34880 RepID=A0A811ZEC3_NYCPR|nr:unnamed protein product [Nyctereutes procyonoides]